MVNDATRRDVATLALPITPQLNCLLNSAPSHRSQKEFYKLLRIDLHDVLPPDSTLPAKVQKIRWQDVGESGGEVSHGKESIDRAVRQAIQGTDAIPETITVSLRLFQCPDLRDCKPVVCAIDIDVESKRFALIPLPMQIQDVMDAVIDEIAAHITEKVKDAGVPVYRGHAT